MARKSAPREIRECPRHGMIEHGRYKRGEQKGDRWKCLECARESIRKRCGHLPMADNHECPAWLGIYIAERALSKFFDNIERLPVGSSGGDFRCGKGKLIDVKSSCPTGKQTPCFHFNINRNIVADYFLCLGFKDRESLEPLHVWLIPGEDVNYSLGISITMGKRSLANWSKYEKSLDKVVARCDQMRETSKA